MLLRALTVNVDYQTIPSKKNLDADESLDDNLKQRITLRRFIRDCGGIS